MARLIYSMIMSLDGYVADEEGNFDWAAPDKEVHQYCNDMEREVKLVTAMSKQVDAVREALGSEWTAVPVRPVLCFVGAEWPLLAKPFELQEVLVTWPKAMRELLVRPGPYAPATVQLIGSNLDERLRPAS